MSDQIDSAIKLFGMTISLTKVSDHDHEPSSSPGTVSFDHNLLSGEGTQVNVSEKQGKENPQKDNQEGRTSNQIQEDSKDPTTSSGISENPKTPSADRETSPHKSSKRGEQSETSSSQEKPLKKPDKIIPCPRCNSMDTKFCYYNNYNVNQQRHFCKNCQRHWTAGGSMRNVPVGAGRRKSKTSSSSNHHDIAVSEGLLEAQASGANGLVFGGHILTFSSDSPLSESVASVPNLSQKTQPLVRNGTLTPEQKKVISTSGGAIRDEQTSGAASKHFSGFPQVCFPAAPWPYPWYSALPMPPPAFCPPGFPVSFYPTPAYWGYNVAPPVNPTSPTLGKHSRDESSWSESNLVKEQSSRKTNHSERHVLVPKTLRIDDPDEAAKSSIWATLGFTSDKTTSIGTGSLFNGFQSKSNERSHRAQAPSVLQANPAALSRSVKFRERT